MKDTECQGGGAGFRVAVGAQIASLGTDKAGEATAVQGEGEAVGEGGLGMPVAGAVVVPIGLEHGLRIAVGVVKEAPPPGVDCEADLQRVEAFLRGV